jgi:hypothetical protein
VNIQGYVLIQCVVEGGGGESGCAESIFRNYTLCI